MAKPRKHAVALVILKPRSARLALVVLRPADDEELPGIWGLPAGSVKRDETPEAAALRVGREKLGLVLRLKRPLAVGEQERPAYTLTMTVFSAEIAAGKPPLPNRRGGPAVTMYEDWRWAEDGVLQEGAMRGSLCCQLYLQHRRQAAAPS
ncbi:MAG: NUDIX hydrolase [Dehalococcoidia bacterium]|nr:NUDIX hydrolase [Dehalococcoidia bacterium]